MQLLLFLSALLTGFTGMIAGERVMESPRVQSSAPGAAIEALAEIAEPARNIAAIPALPREIASSRQHLSPADVGAVHSPTRVNESRLE